MTGLRNVAVAAALFAAARGHAQSTSGLTGRWAITIGTQDTPEYRTLEAVVASNGTISGTLGSPNGAVPIQAGRLTGARFTLEATLILGAELERRGVIASRSKGDA